MKRRSSTGEVGREARPITVDVIEVTEEEEAEETEPKPDGNDEFAGVTRPVHRPKPLVS